MSKRNKGKITGVGEQVLAKNVFFHPCWQYREQIPVLDDDSLYSLQIPKLHTFSFNIPKGRFVSKYISYEEQQKKRAKS